MKFFKQVEVWWWQAHSMEQVVWALHTAFPHFVRALNRDNKSTENCSAIHNISEFYIQSFKLFSVKLDSDKNNNNNVWGEEKN